MIETVNGYVCHNCSDVALAKRDIDPAHPKDGPNGVDAASKSSTRDPAVVFGGSLTNQVAQSSSSDPAQLDASAQARNLDLKV